MTNDKNTTTTQRRPTRPPIEKTTTTDSFSEPRPHLDFATRDHLALAQHPHVKQAALAAIETHGVHDRCSENPGTNQASTAIEATLSEITQRESCLLFPTATAARFAAVTALARNNDTIIIDTQAHHTLQASAHTATRNVYRFAHNDTYQVEGLLKKAREETRHNNVLVILESLNATTSQSPDLSAILELATRYQATVILDVSNDFGSTGTRGLGLIEGVNEPHRPIVIMGSFSNTLASSGGFVLTTNSIANTLSARRDLQRVREGISPLQAAVMIECLNIAFSEEGQALRRKLLENSLSLRAHLLYHDCDVLGEPSPIVPVLVRNETVAGHAAREARQVGLATDLVSFPEVAMRKARLRLHMKASHTKEEVARAAAIIAACLKEAREQTEATTPAPPA